jgi:hypothetical protein
MVRLKEYSPEKAGVGGSTPSLAPTSPAISFTSLPFFIIHMTAELEGEQLLASALITSKQAG